jgi:hypothetical protein
LVLAEHVFKYTGEANLTSTHCRSHTPDWDLPMDCLATVAMSAAGRIPRPLPGRGEEEK